MSHDAAARREDQVGRAERRIGAARLTPVWPEEKTGIASAGLSGNSGVRQARADAITLSSGSQNLLASPLTCMWSAPARRQIFCQAR